jgi:hypothetical protein
MNLVLGFIPFILFTLLSGLSADLGLWAAFAAAFVITIRDFIERPQLRLLDGVSLLLFGLMALWRGFLDQGLNPFLLRAAVDLVLTAVILTSLLLRRPFSLQYAGRGGWSEEAFLRVNYVISLAWLAAFAVIALADSSAAIGFGPISAGVGISILALAVAAVFTLRYPTTAKH